VNNYPVFAINRYYVKEQRNTRNVPTEWSARERDGSSGEIKVTRRKQKRVFTSGLPQGRRVLTIDKVSRSDWNIESNASFRIPMNIENVSAKRWTPAVGSRFKENLIPQMINDFPLIVSCRRASFLVFIRPSAFHTRDDVTRNALCHADFVIFLHAKRAVWSMHFHEWKAARLPSYAEDPTSGKPLARKTAIRLAKKGKELALIETSTARSAIRFCSLWPAMPEMRNGSRNDSQRRDRFEEFTSGERERERYATLESR